MRTTLDIDDDVLRAAKELARREKKTAGAVISELARRVCRRLVEGGDRRASGRAGVPPDEATLWNAPTLSCEARPVDFAEEERRTCVFGLGEGEPYSRWRRS